MTKTYYESQEKEKNDVENSISSMAFVSVSNSRRNIFHARYEVFMVFDYSRVYEL